MDRPLPPPIHLRSVSTPVPLSYLSAYHLLSASIPSATIPSTQRTQLTRLIDALGVQTGQIDRASHLKAIKEREGERRRIEREERQKRKVERRARRVEEEQEELEKVQREQKELEEQLENDDESLSDDEVNTPEGGSYEAEASSDEEGTGLRDTATDGLDQDALMEVDE